VDYLCATIGIGDCVLVSGPWQKRPSETSSRQAKSRRPPFIKSLAMRSVRRYPAFRNLR
jgi:hypothetical protein